MIELQVTYRTWIKGDRRTVTRRMRPREVENYYLRPVIAAMNKVGISDGEMARALDIPRVRAANIRKYLDLPSVTYRGRQPRVTEQVMAQKAREIVQQFKPA